MENTKDITATQPSTQEIKLRHQRFDNFDIYSVKIPGKEKLLFHKPESKKFTIAGTFKFLGSYENLWLCEDINNNTIHIAPFTKFKEIENLDSKL